MSQSKFFPKEGVSVQSGDHRNKNNQSGGVSFEEIVRGWLSLFFFLLLWNAHGEGQSSRINVNQQRTGFSVKAELILQSVFILHV